MTGRWLQIPRGTCGQCTGRAGVVLRGETRGFRNVRGPQSAGARRLPRAHLHVEAKRAPNGRRAEGRPQRGGARPQVAARGRSSALSIWVRHVVSRTCSSRKSARAANLYRTCACGVPCAVGRVRRIGRTPYGLPEHVMEADHATRRDARAFDFIDSLRTSRACDQSLERASKRTPQMCSMSLPPGHVSVARSRAIAASMRSRVSSDESAALFGMRFGSGR